MQNGVEQALKQGSYSGKDADGNDTFNGEVRREHRIDIVTGLPGSGKSSVYSNRISQEHGSRIIDTDDYRPYIPEYNGRNAPVVHEESSKIKKSVLTHSLDNGENIILSTVGDDAVKLSKDILKFKEQGYDVYLHLNELSNVKSMGRVVSRYITDEGELKRLVLPELVLDMGDNPTKAFVEIVGLEGTQYDNGGNQSGVRESGRERRSDARRIVEAARKELAGFDWYNNDVEYGQPARLVLSSEQVTDLPKGTGAAEMDFETGSFILTAENLACNPLIFRQ